MKTALTIAGSDCSGGAGIQADLKAMLANGVYGMSVITALTAQNTQGVKGVLEVEPSFLAQQLEAVFEDIFPDAVKIGMVSNAKLILTISKYLRKYAPRNVVVDPVMVATSGARLLSEGALEALKTDLFPLACLLTPNIPESEILCGFAIRSPEDMERAARSLGDKYQVAVLCKGGHQLNDANDFLYDGKKGYWFHGERIDNPNTHGTGCTLSSSIAAHLAKGENLEEAIRASKDYLSRALASGLNLGQGRGPLNHAV